MSPVIKRRSSCRLCGMRKFDRVVSLKPSPLANSFLDKNKIAEEEISYDLDLYFCCNCNHVQLLDVVDPRLLFNNYVYVSGTSFQFVKHFESYANKVISKYEVPEGSFVLEIGSNDGTFLRKFIERKMEVLGVDPAKEIALNATKNGINTWPQFFSQELAAEIYDKIGVPRIIAANNVFAHCDNLSEIIEGVKTLMDRDSILIFEVSYLLDVYKKTLFDTIYHEHLDYHAVRPLKSFFDNHGMKLIDVERVASHGGSIRCAVQLSDGNYKISDTVDKFCSLEIETGLDTQDPFIEFVSRIDSIGRRLKELLLGIREDGKKIVGFGAPAKSTTLLNHYGIGGDILDYIVDDNQLKQGLYTPGGHIPILATEQIYQTPPDYLLILAWNFYKSIVDAHASYFSQGGRFIVPLPEPMIVQ